MKKLWPGDTLIEVLFAFAILSLVISVMFSGAMSSYKSALTAQDRTVALFVAQYQADGLKAYRDSLGWDNASGQQYTFLDANAGTNLSVPASQQDLIKARELATNNTVFCMNKPYYTSDADQYIYWKIYTATSDCNGVAKKLAPTLNNPNIEIRLVMAPDSKSATATIKVNWTARNSNTTETVTNTILLTEQR